jgi:DNA-binding PadR family transcriptional regulator
MSSKWKRLPLPCVTTDAQGWVASKWGTTAGNRRARYYQLTPAGRKQLTLEMTQFERVIGAMMRVIEAVRKELLYELAA